MMVQLSTSRIFRNISNITTPADDVFAIARARETSSQTMTDDVRAIARARETSSQTMTDDFRAIARALETSSQIMTVLGFYP